MKPNNRELSQRVSHALRHEPWLYELELDTAGWTTVDAVLDSLRRSGDGWTDLSRDDLERMIADSSKRRHEIEGDRIRALYGHSVHGLFSREAAVPPERLFHGTSRAACEAILSEGLKPMGRQYVHLSVDVETARAVGERKDSDPVLLEVSALRASKSGVQLYRGNEKVWLAKEVPVEFLKRLLGSQGGADPDSV